MTEESSKNRESIQVCKLQIYLLLPSNLNNYLIRAAELQIKHTQHVFIKEEGKRNNILFLNEDKPCSMAKRTMPDRVQSCLGLRYCPMKPEELTLEE